MSQQVFLMIITDTNATYYLTASENSDYIKDGYQTEAAYDVTLKSVENSASEATAVEGNVTLTIQIPVEQ